MRLGVGEGERLCGGGDQADQALAGPHGGEVHRLAVEALGGEEFEIAVVAQDVDRADLGDHVGRDQDDDAVEARLRADGLRHGLAKAAQ